MVKIETPEKLAARKAKDQKELAKWRREQQKPKRKFYLLYLLVVLSLVLRPGAESLLHKCESDFIKTTSFSFEIITETISSAILL